MNNKSSEQTISRRTALALGAGFMLPLAGQCAAPAVATHHYDLFVFKAPKAEQLVIAVTFAKNSHLLTRWAEPEFNVCLHANEKSWAIAGPRPMPSVAASQRLDGRIFAGRILGRQASASATHNAVVLETPFDALIEAETLQVWAEIFAEDGSRLRVGSPLLAEILAGDPELSRVYHRLSPAQDRDRLSNEVARRLATLSAAGTADSRAHGQRLTGFLLPDVIRYRPDRPVGFTFASQNGRHPADDTAGLVSTILTGAATCRSALAPLPLRAAFPYFALPTQPLSNPRS